jgi:two-component system cell cycle response regulator DivK
MAPSVLIIHANSDDREMYAEYLSANGFRVTEAGTTDAALPLILEAEAVVTGLLVPGSFDGVELITRIRQDPVTAEKPIVVVTACTFSHQLERARRAGANVVLLKPCLPAALLDELQRLLESDEGIRAAGEPPAPPDRRRLGDRRAEWRGGRRDSDWTGRPRLSNPSASIEQ